MWIVWAEKPGKATIAKHTTRITFLLWLGIGGKLCRPSNHHFRLARGVVISNQCRRAVALNTCIAPLLDVSHICTLVFISMVESLKDTYDKVRGSLAATVAIQAKKI
jgi:hypothetical protein